MTEYIASSLLVGRRPRISRIRAYSSAFRPSSAHGCSRSGSAGRHGHRVEGAGRAGRREARGLGGTLGARVGHGANLPARVPSLFVGLRPRRSAAWTGCPYSSVVVEVRRRVDSSTSVGSPASSSSRSDARSARRAARSARFSARAARLASFSACLAASFSPRQPSRVVLGGRRASLGVASLAARSGHWPCRAMSSRRRTPMRAATHAAIGRQPRSSCCLPLSTPGETAGGGAR